MKATIDVAIAEKKAGILTWEFLKQNVGKMIVTKYFGYRGQDGYDLFKIGTVMLDHCTWGNQDSEYHIIKAEENPDDYFHKKVLFTHEGRNTFIRMNTTPERYNQGICWCSDEDREVFFIIIE